MLAHQSHNGAAPKTIVLVHGGFSSHAEWEGVWPLLEAESYHLLIPDLPSHEDSAINRPFTVDDAARRRAHLTAERAHDQVAHVVAISIGAHVAACLASQYPQRVASLVASWFNLFTSSLFSPILPPVVYLLQHTSTLVQNPAAARVRLLSGQGSLSMTEDVLNILTSAKELKPIAVRMLVIAATKDSLLPKHRVGNTQRLFATVTPNNGSRMMQHRQMRHAWNVEEP